MRTIRRSMKQIYSISWHELSSSTIMMIVAQPHDDKMYGFVAVCAERNIVRCPGSLIPRRETSRSRSR